MHDLQGHETVETKIDRLVHRRHPAACEKCANLVARTNHLADESRARTRLHSCECRSALTLARGATRPSMPGYASNISITGRTSVTRCGSDPAAICSNCSSSRGTTRDASSS